MSKDGRTWLSHTGLENLERCPRCFWLQYKKKIYQPEGIVSRLPNRFDTVLKSYFNIYRETGEMPPMVEGKIEGVLQNPFQEKYFADVGQQYGFWGKLDECVVTPKDTLVPVDFKTASSDPRQKEILDAYRSQIDDYVFLLEKNGKKTAGYGYLIYVYPDEGKALHKGFPMIVHVVKLEGDPNKTEKRLKKAMEILDEGVPKPASECPFCTWYETVTSHIHTPKHGQPSLFDA